MKDDFLRNLELARSFYHTNQNLNIPKDYKVDNVRLGIWILSLRTRYKKGTLSKDQIVALEEIGMIWNVKENELKKKLEIVKDYYQKNHTLSIVYPQNEEEEQIQAWIYRWRFLYQRGKLSNYAYQVLKECGMNFDSVLNQQKSKLEEFYQQALAYYEQHHSLWITEPKNEKEQKLKKNIYHYGELYRLNRISEEYIKKLDKIGFPWHIREIKMFFQRLPESRQMSYLSAILRMISTLKRFPLFEEVEEVSPDLARWYRYLVTYGPELTSPKVRELWLKLCFDLVAYHEMEQNIQTKRELK